MEIEIISYGIARDIVGSSKYKMKLEKPLSVEELLALLQHRFSKFKELTSLFIAVNDEYAKKDYLIQEDDEVVLIPPVSGG